MFATCAGAVVVTGWLVAGAVVVTGATDVVVVRSGFARSSEDPQPTTSNELTVRTASPTAHRNLPTPTITHS
jgi:hypothetical protein